MKKKPVGRPRCEPTKAIRIPAVLVPLVMKMVAEHKRGK